jgi:hypothetical protein
VPTGIGFRRLCRERGDEMRKCLWRGSLGTALVTIGVFLAACSHDPIQPAPIYLMGAAGPTAARSPPVSALRPAVPAAQIRQAVAVPPPAVDHAPAIRHRSNRQIAAQSHTTGARNGQRATSHVAAAPSRRANPYSGSGNATAATVGAEMIPLDPPTGATAGPAATPPASATALEPFGPSRATAPPAEPPHAEFRPPSP